MPRNTKKKEDDTVYYTEEELEAMTPEQKLKRVKDLEGEIKGLRQRLKDEQGSTRDCITECQAKISALLDSVPK